MKILRALGCLFLTFSLLFTIFIGKDKISSNTVVKEHPSYKGIITLWQIDQFEGGRGSRRQFLLDTAVAFEKKHKGTLIMVIQHTVTSALESAKEGNLPDMISYSSGLNLGQFTELSAITGCDVGKVGDKFYAYPWCRGGYALIFNPNKVSQLPSSFENLTVSQSGEYTLPVVALLQEEISVKKVEVLSPMQAYLKFVEGKIPYMLGTQRDVNRLYVREMEVVVKPLTKFNDLYQCISVITSDSQKSYYSKLFAEYLMSQHVQEKLHKIGMLSVGHNSISDVVSLNEMQKVRCQTSISPFISASELVEIQKLSLQAIDGNQNALTKIKNVLILS